MYLERRRLLLDISQNRKLDGDAPGIVRECSRCNEGYYKDANGDCQSATPSTPNCSYNSSNQDVNSQYLCEYCHEDYFREADKTCALNSADQKGCRAKNGDKCSECNRHRGYFAIGFDEAKGQICGAVLPSSSSKLNITKVNSSHLSGLFCLILAQILIFF